MRNALLEVEFYPTFDRARHDGPAFNYTTGVPHSKLRVTEMRTHNDLTVAVEWSRSAGKPKDPSEVPDDRFIFARGGTIYEVKAKLWDADTASVLLVLVGARQAP